MAIDFYSQHHRQPDVAERLTHRLGLEMGCGVGSAAGGSRWAAARLLELNSPDKGTGVSVRKPVRTVQPLRHPVTASLLHRARGFGPWLLRIVVVMGGLEPPT